MKKAKQLLVCLLVVFMVAALFAGCSGSDNKDKAGEASKTSEEKTASGEKNTKKSAEKASEESSKNPVEGKRIGVAHISKYDEWCAAVSNEFESQGKALGFAEINVQDGNLDHETQLKQIENFITKEYDMIIVDPVNPEGIIEVLERVDAAGIPVICFDSQTNWDKLVSYVAWDHAATGELMGKYVRKYIEDELGGKANVAILDMKSFPHTAVRAETFKKELEPLGDSVKIVSDQDFQGNREIAANIVSNIKEHVDVIYSVVDNGAWGAVSALEAKGIKGTKVFSAGAYGKEPFEALKNNHPYYKACVVVPPQNIVKDTLEIAVKYFKGETDDIPKRKNIDIAIYDSSNISEIYN